MNLKDEFFKWFHSNFVFTPLYSAMNNTSEASKWHREDSVGVHTAMVVAEYIKFSPNEWNTDDLCGAIACAFHDTGKPAARTEKHSEERGVYYSYPGHEQISARLWEDWAVSNWITFEKFGLVPNDIYRIGWVIEHHLPYATVKADKVGRMVETVVNMFGSNRIMSTVLLADQFGRISDDMEYNRNKVVVWVDEFNKKCDEFMATNSTNDVGKKPTCTLLIGPSGCGKSTYTEVYQALYGPVQHYSWDDLRMQWYSPKTGDVKHDYSAAWAASTEDKQFQQKADAAFNSMLSGEDVFVDNLITPTLLLNVAASLWKLPTVKVIMLLVCCFRLLLALSKNAKWGVMINKCRWQLLKVCIFRCSCHLMAKLITLLCRKVTCNIFLPINTYNIYGKFLWQNH